MLKKLLIELWIKFNQINNQYAHTLSSTGNTSKDLVCVSLVVETKKTETTTILRRQPLPSPQVWPWETPRRGPFCLWRTVRVPPLGVWPWRMGLWNMSSEERGTQWLAKQNLQCRVIPTSLIDYLFICF